MSVSARSRLTAGVFAAAAGIALVAPVAVPPAAVPSLTAIASPAIQLSAALSPLAPLAPIAQPVRSAASTAAAVGQTPGDWIINAYFTIQPWVEYGVEVFAWATEWLPWPIGLLAPQADIIYSGWQPFAESVAFALAYLVDGQFDLVLPTLTFGIQTGISTFIQNEIAWIASFFPPLPPIGFAAATAPAGTAIARVAAAEPDAETVAEAAAKPLAEQAAAPVAEAEFAPAEAANDAHAAQVEGSTPEASGVAEVTEVVPEEAPAAEPAAAPATELAAPAPAPRAVRPSARTGLRTQQQAPAPSAAEPADSPDPATSAAAADTAPAAAAMSGDSAPKARKSARSGRTAG